MPAKFLERGGGWVVAHNILSVGVVVAGPLRHGAWHNAWGVACGALLFVAGGALGIAGVRALGKNRTPYPEPRDEGKLVTGGVYRLVRHPLYGSLVLASAGWSLLWQSWVALILAAILTAVLFAKSRREEIFLRAKFPAYTAYAQRTRRMIPWIF